MFLEMYGPAVDANGELVPVGRALLLAADELDDVAKTDEIRKRWRRDGDGGEAKREDVGDALDPSLRPAPVRRSGPWPVEPVE